MVIKTVKGMYQIQRNYREAFNQESFIEKYIEECMDKYLYIVGDISSGILRLKGFDTDPKSKNYYGLIDDYLENSCAFGCPYYVLKRIKSEQEFEKLSKSKEENNENGVVIHSIKKENFDKDSLILVSTPKEKPNIVIDMVRVNAIPKGELTADLLEFVKQDKMSSASNSKSMVQTVSEPAEATYVSSSPDFDPSKSNSNRFNRGNHSKNDKGHNKHKNYNKNK